MAEDFFGELGEAITRTAKDLGDKADTFFETQKLRNKMNTEQRMIDKNMADLGNIIYKRYVEGAPLDHDLTVICEDITQRKVEIANYKEEIVNMKGQKVCPACGESMAKDASFCPKCGAACPTPSVEPEAQPDAETQTVDTEDVEAETPVSADVPEEAASTKEAEEEPKKEA